MDIFNLIHKINDKIEIENSPFYQLSELRKKHLGKKRLPKTVFTDSSVFNKESIYAFHHGGRAEMQFNIGQEDINGRIITRVCLAFSLEPSRSLPEPIETLREYKDRFNSLVKEKPEVFDGFEMWIYQHENRTKNYFPKQINSKEFKDDTFIAIGNIIDKPIIRLSNKDIDFIVGKLNLLLPIYQYCVLGVQLDVVIEKKMTRICYNTEGWSRPSGLEGKSKSEKSYEYKTGFGHEEWLFDFDKLIDGYHYGFAQAISDVPKHIGKTYELTLFTINADDKERSWVATIKNAVIIDFDEKQKVFEHYRNNGWLKEMHEQLKKLGVQHNVVNGNKINLNKELSSGSFNIKFKPDDVIFHLKPFDEEDNDVVTATYYKLYDAEKLQLKEKKKRKITPNTPPDKPPKTDKRISKPKIVEFSYIHYNVAVGLYNELAKIHGAKNTYWEFPLAYGARVDIAVNKQDTWIYYEVKSYQDLRISIREALGQLLEYSYWEKENNVTELIIVTQKIKDIKTGKKYIENIRKKYGVEIYYQYYDLEKNKLSEKF